MNEIWKVLRDPRISTTLVLAVVVAAGFGLIAQGYRGAAALTFAPFQVPFLVSGAMLGVAVIGGGLALLNVHLDRTEAAEERREVAALQRDVLRLLGVAPRAWRSRHHPACAPAISSQDGRGAQHGVETLRRRVAPRPDHLAETAIPAPPRRNTR